MTFNLSQTFAAGICRMDKLSSDLKKPMLIGLEYLKAERRLAALTRSLERDITVPEIPDCRSGQSHP